jgi:hypothetical protein
VVSFEEGVQPTEQTELSRSYSTALQPHISESRHGYVLPDFVGSLTGLFLYFAGVNTNKMLYQAFPSIQNNRNVALPFLLFMMVKKIRPFGYHILPAFPREMPVFGSVSLWQKSEEVAPAADDATTPAEQASGAAEADGAEGGDKSGTAEAAKPDTETPDDAGRDKTAS